MQAVAAGNRAAQQELVLRLSGRVLRVARLLARANADAEDAAQRSLMEIIRSAATFSAAASLESWADRITVRTTLRSIHKESRRRALLLRWLLPDVLPWGGSPSVRATELQGIAPLLGRLSHERREVMVLRHVLDYEVEEIAELTQTPLGTVKDRLVQARKQLRRWLLHDQRRARESSDPDDPGANS